MISNYTLDARLSTTKQAELDEEKKLLAFSYTYYGPVALALSKTAPIFDEPVTIKICMTVLLSIILVLSVIGNTITCTVIARNRSMHTGINVYFFCLAVTDLLYSFWIPVDVYVMWRPDRYPLGEVGCVIHVVLIGSLINFSMLTITAFTVERYIAVVKPFVIQTRSKLSRVIKLMICNGILSIVLNFHEAYSTDFYETKDCIFCYTYLSDPVRWVNGAIDLIFIFVPMFITTILYILIALKLRTKNRLEDGPRIRPDREKAVKILAAVAITFILSWFPYFIIRVMVFFSLHLNLKQFYQMWRVIYYVCTINGYLSTAVNPILYTAMSKTFRTAFVCLVQERRRGNTNIRGIASPHRQTSAVFSMASLKDCKHNTHDTLNVK